MRALQQQEPDGRSSFGALHHPWVLVFGPVAREHAVRLLGTAYPQVLQNLALHLRVGATTAGGKVRAFSRPQVRPRVLGPGVEQGDDGRLRWIGQGDGETLIGPGDRGLWSPQGPWVLLWGWPDVEITHQLQVMRVEAGHTRDRATVERKARDGEPGSFLIRLPEAS